MDPAKKSPADVKRVLLEGVSKSCEKKSRRCQSQCSWASLANIEIGGIGGIIPILRSVKRDFFSQNMDSEFSGSRPTHQTLVRSRVRVTSGYLGIWELQVRGPLGTSTSKVFQSLCAWYRGKGWKLQKHGTY